MINIILSGAPGAGKGTQAEKLKCKYELVHLSTGDIIRKEIELGTTLGKQLEADNKIGKYAPDDVMIDLIAKNVREAKKNKIGGFIFDGFPRTVNQYNSLAHIFLLNDLRLTSIIHLDVPTEIVIERIRNRGLTSNRPDDQNIETILERINQFKTKTEELLKYYAFEHEFVWIKATGTPEEVFEEIKLKLNI